MAKKKIIPIEEISILDDPLFADPDPPPDESRLDGTFYTQQQFEWLKDMDVDSELVEKSDQIARAAKAMSELAQANNRSLQNHLNAGRYVDVAEAQVYLRGILTVWIDTLRMIGEDHAVYAQKYKLSTKITSAMLKDVSNKAISLGEELLADMEAYTQKFILEASAKRLTKGSGSNMRRGRAGNERVK